MKQTNKEKRKKKNMCKNVIGERKHYLLINSKKNLEIFVLGQFLVGQKFLWHYHAVSSIVRLLILCI